MKFWSTILLTAFALISPAKATEYGSLSIKLKPWMTEQLVMNILGQPTSTSLTICGPQGDQFNCKIWNYYSDTIGQGLQVSFQSVSQENNQWVVKRTGSGSLWVVAGWSSY